jgi:Rhodopirellula transposase DDE domain
LEHDTAGDPITGLKWTRKTPQKIAELLEQVDIPVSANTVARLLHNMNYSLRANHKKLVTGTSPFRDQQFQYISSLRHRFERRGLPMISVDTKKRELVGHFKNAGVKWDRSPVLVNDHDFRSDSTGVAIPYGVYDLLANRGSVFLGVSHDTSAFAVHSIAGWWKREGAVRYRRARQLLILADTGGSNSCRRHAWKTELQAQLSNPFDLTVTVAHYPTGTSKWNPIEHRLFSEISKNWAAEPLHSYQTILNFLRTTTTKTGLGVSAYLDRTHYPTGLDADPVIFRSVCLRPHKTLPMELHDRPQSVKLFLRGS